MDIHRSTVAFANGSECAVGTPGSYRAVVSPAMKPMVGILVGGPAAQRFDDPGEAGS